MRAPEEARSGRLTPERGRARWNGQKDKNVMCKDCPSMSEVEARGPRRDSCSGWCRVVGGPWVRGGVSRSAGPGGGGPTSAERRPKAGALTLDGRVRQPVRRLRPAPDPSHQENFHSCSATSGELGSEHPWRHISRGCVSWSRLADAGSPFKLGWMSMPSGSSARVLVIKPTFRPPPEVVVGCLIGGTGSPARRAIRAWRS